MRFFSVAIALMLLVAAPAQAGDAPAGALGAVQGMQRMSEIVVDMIFSGVFDRFPGCQLVGVEVGIGWIPHAAEMIDDRYWRNRTRLGLELKKLPSQYLKDNFTATFIIDKIGVQLRHAVGINSMETPPAPSPPVLTAVDTQLARMPPVM